jgi:hypothetical protein
MSVNYVPKEKLFPKFGEANSTTQQIYIREDLPKITQPFLIAHETYHLTDKTKFWLYREIRANFYAGIKHPVGFITICFMSLSLDRLKYYWKRIKTKT